MTVAVWLCLGLAVLACWLAGIAFVRSRTSLERLHCAAFVNVAGGGAITLAALLSDGITPRSIKVVIAWLVTLMTGALLSFRVGRALHLRSGEKR